MSILHSTVCSFFCLACFLIIFFNRLTLPFNYVTNFYYPFDKRVACRCEDDKTFTKQDEKDDVSFIECNRSPSCHFTSIEACGTVTMQVRLLSQSPSFVQSFIRSFVDLFTQSTIQSVIRKRVAVVNISEATLEVFVVFNECASHADDESFVTSATKARQRSTPRLRPSPDDNHKRPTAVVTRERVQNTAMSGAHVRKEKTRHKGPEATTVKR